MPDLNRERLARCLELAMTDSDGEAVAAIRAVKRLLTASGLTWEALLVGLAPRVASAPRLERPKWVSRRQFSDLVDEMFEDAYANIGQRSKRVEFVASLEAQWDERGSLSIRQVEVLADIAGTSLPWESA